MKNELKKVKIIIPALNPNVSIIKLVEDLKKVNLDNIIVINDGSNEESKPWFDKLNYEYDVKIINHNINKGKGEAIKTGIREILNDDLIGIITVDADGQHTAKDVRKIAENLKDEKVILGVRQLKNNKEVPLASRIGNLFSSIYFKTITGIYLEDTQTGLRGIPKKFLKFALNVEGSRYEYEMNFLKQMNSNNIGFKTIPIETIYENRIKNFRIIKDSYIIYKDFFKNLISSTICAIADVVLFYIFNYYKIQIFLANIFARILSGILDFIINQKWVFKKRTSKNTSLEIYKYILLFIVQMLINSIIVTILNNYIQDNIIYAKIIVNVFMYIINFIIKKKYIFN